MTVLGYLCMLLVGVSLGMLGGGGSILTVPILTYLFGLDAVHATAYSLFIVGLSAAVGAVGKMKQGNVKPKVGALLAIPGFLGVFLSRAFLIPLLPTHVFALNDFVLTKDMFIMMIFAIMMLAASYSMIRGRRNTSSRDSTAKPMHHGKIIFGGFLIGVLTGFVGAGGGFMIIPALIGFAGVSMSCAVGTSLMIIAVNSLFGFTGELVSGESVAWIFLSSLAGIAAIGIAIGTYMAKFVSERVLKKSFGFFVLAMGLVILVEQLSK